MPVEQTHARGGCSKVGQERAFLVAPLEASNALLKRRQVAVETEAAGVNARGVGLGDHRDSLSGHNHVRNTWPALRIVHALVVERGARRTARKRAIALTRPVSLLLGPVHPTKDGVPDSSSPGSLCTPSRPAAACLHSPRLRRGSFHSLLSGVRLGGAGAVYRLRRGARYDMKRRGLRVGRRCGGPKPLLDLDARSRCRSWTGLGRRSRGLPACRDAAFLGLRAEADWKLVNPVMFLGRKVSRRG